MVAEDRLAALEERVARLEEHPPARRRPWWEDDEAGAAGRRDGAGRAPRAATGRSGGPEYVGAP
ncbi:MAG TPA: hypothetical protein VI300_16775, partial [Solirubrobacter sp.]